MRYAAALFLLVAIASAAVAQSPLAPVEPRFEVASVKAALSPAELGRLAAALQQQLGLKLEKQTGPMPVVIINAADHPTPD